MKAVIEQYVATDPKDSLLTAIIMSVGGFKLLVTARHTCHRFASQTHAV